MWKMSSLSFSKTEESKYEKLMKGELVESLTMNTLQSVRKIKIAEMMKSLVEQHEHILHGDLPKVPYVNDT